MSLQPKPYYSFEDYLAAERACIDEKHEYVAGQVFAMTGASFNHNRIAANLVRHVGNRLDSGSCVVVGADMRLRIEAADACTYPDVAVLCDRPTFHGGRRDVLTNPTLLIEVLSPSTEGYDRGGKFALYRSLPSLRQYVLVAQDRYAVDVFTRQPGDRWLLEAYTDPRAEIPLESIGCALPVGEIYDKVDFALPDEAPGPG